VSDLLFISIFFAKKDNFIVKIVLPQKLTIPRYTGLLILDKDFKIVSLFAMGKLVIEDGVLLKKGTYER